MGAVWVAEQMEPVRRRVALKVIKPGMDSMQVLRRFEAERQVLALMDHTHIAKVFDAGATPEGRPYFVLELIKGAPMTKYCDELHLPIRERLELFVPVCQAIQHAHQKGIIHRDIKPSNVLVAIEDSKPVAKVIDFGVAKALHQRLTEESIYTEIGQIVGTLEYMSPEQAELSVLDIDTRADIYALGALLYELLTGSTPLDRKRLHSAAFAEMMRMIKEDEPPKPSTRLTQSEESLASLAAQRRTEPAKLTKAVRGELDWIVMKCLEKDRTLRYDNANSLARDVERYLHDEPVEACPPTAGYRLRKFAHKYRMHLIVAGAFALLLVAGAVVSAWQAVRATDAEREATRKRQEAEASEYAARMGLVRAAWDSHNILQVRDLLDQTAAYPGRGFEWYYWQRLCRVEHLTLTGHQGGVTALAFAPDGQRLVTGVTDGMARVWDATRGQELFSLGGHQGQVTAVAFAPDGQWLVTGSMDGTARVWDAVGGRELRMLRSQHTGPVWAVAVTPDGKRVITGSEDGTARVWDAVSGRELLLLKGHTALPVLGASMVGLLSSLQAPGPVLGASAVYPGRIGHTAPISAVAVTGDGKCVVTGSYDGTATIWDAANGNHLQTLDHDAGISAAVVTWDGKRVVTGSGSGVAKIWDTESGTTVRTIPGGHGDLFALALTPDGKQVLTGYWGGTANVRDMASGREILTLMGHRHWVSCVAVSPDGQRLATGSLDGTARVWDTRSGRGTRTLPVHTGPVRSIAATADGQRLVTASGDGTVKLWDAASARELQTLNAHSDPVWCVAFTPDGQQIVGGCEDGTARIWDAVSGRELRKFTGHSDRVWSVAVTPDGHRIVTGSWDGTAKVWDAVSGRVLHTLKGHIGPVWCVAVTSDGQRLITGGQEGTARVWETASGRKLLTLQGHTYRVQCVAATPEGQRVITGSGDGTARVWDAVSGRELLKLTGHIEPGLCVAVTADGQRIVTGSGNGTASIWDAVSGRELLTLKGHTGPVQCVAVASDGRRIITGSHDGTVNIWDAAAPEQVALWERQEQEAARRQAIWQRPVDGTPGFVQEWLVLAPLPLKGRQGLVEGLERDQLRGEARLQPRAGEHARVDGREYTWQAYREKEPVLDFNRFVGKRCDHCVAYAVCYVISAAERDDLLLQVGSDPLAKVYFNEQEVYKYPRARSLVALDPVGPVTLRKGTNVLVFKVVNGNWGWLGCARFIDRDSNPVQGLRVRLAPE
jgi:WD40 repeat protein/tRNA A-37 threonylcarbamoyl transferase component Bud32